MMGGAVAGEQLCFFKFSRPLVERFGKEFFKAVPRVPGVYVFSGENGRPLYVGHSKNLRERLSYYKNAQPEREPRRIVRLVHQIREIALEPCDTVEVAQVRELALIRQLRPKFNVANTLSRTYSYFAFRESESGVEVRLRMSEMAADGERIVGGFKNRGLCARALISLARTSWAQEREVSSVYDFPARLNNRMAHWQFSSGYTSRVWAMVHGEGETFLQESATLVEKTSDPFLRQVFEADFIALAEFTELAKEMAELRNARETEILTQEALQVSGRLARQRQSTGAAPA